MDPHRGRKFILAALLISKYVAVTGNAFSRHHRASDYPVSTILFVKWLHNNYRQRDW